MPTWLLVILFLLAPFVALASGRATAERRRALFDDLAHGRARGFAAVAGAVAIFVIIQLVNSRASLG